MWMNTGQVVRTDILMREVIDSIPQVVCKIFLRVVSGICFELAIIY